jgi:tetratricopeptide (TPR) repeat protein
VKLHFKAPFDLPYRVEQWDDADRHVEELIALAADDGVAKCSEKGEGRKVIIGKVKIPPWRFSARTLRETIRLWVCAAVLGVSVAAVHATPFEDCFSQDDLDRKVKGCTQVIKQKSTSPEDRALAYVNRGGIYGRRGKCALAIADYNKAIDLDPKLASAYNNRGYCYLEADKPDLALADYTKAIELEPGDGFTYWNRAGIYVDSERYDLAIADYTKAIDLDFKVADSYVGRAQAYDKKGDAKLALADYTKAIELDPDNAKNYSDRAALFANQNDQDAAIADYTKAIAMRSDEDNGADYWLRGQSYTDIGEYDLAIADYTKSLDLITEDVADFAPLVLWNRAVAKGLKGDQDGEIADWTSLLEDDPDTSSAYYARGAAHYFKGDLSSAEKDVLRSLEVKPSAYAAAILFLVQTAKGGHAKSELQANAQKLDDKEWPFPVTEYFLEKRSEADLLTAATVPWQTCEANVFIGLLKRVKGDRNGASGILQKTVGSCPKGDQALGWAKVELRRTGNSTASEATETTDKTPKTSGISREMELSFWNSVKDSNDPAMLQAYLDKFPDGTFASLAKIKLEKLNKN